MARLSCYKMYTLCLYWPQPATAALLKVRSSYFSGLARRAARRSMFDVVLENDPPKRR